MVALNWLLFSGSIITRSETPAGLQWLKYCSYSFYAHQALIHNELWGKDYGKAYLISKGLDEIDLWPSVGYLICYMVICGVAGVTEAAF